MKAEHRELRRGVEQSVRTEDLQTHFDLGIAYREMGLFPEAAYEFDIAAASPRLAAEAHCLKGICHRAAGMPQAALSSFLEEIASPKATNRQKARCSYELACLYVELGREQLARREYARALELDSGLPQEYPGDNSSHLKGAREAFAGGGSRDAFRPARDDDPVLDEGAEILEIEILLRASPGDVGARIELAKFLAENNRIGEARAHYGIAAEQYRSEARSSAALACDIQLRALAAAADGMLGTSAQRCGFCDTPIDLFRPPARSDTTIACADCLVEARSFFARL